MISISINNLNLSFNDNKTPLSVLEHISCEIERSQIVTILGPSGCGKSTLLRCIAGLIKPSSGTISLGGMPAHILAERKKIGFAFQDPCLLGWLSVRQNLLLPTEIGLKQGNAQSAQARMQRLLVAMGMSDFEDFHPGQLSGGMKQRVSLARALMTDPELLLLDEPLTGLDWVTQRALLIAMEKALVEAGCTTLIVTHNVEEAAFWGRKILVFSRRPGRIIGEVENAGATARTISFCNSDQFKTTVERLTRLLTQECYNEGSN